MQCRYCGAELPDGCAFCSQCGQPQQTEPAPPTPAAATEEQGIRCPHCGSTRLQFTTTVKTQGVSVGDACCGYVCLGPLGLLCGLCGAGSTETKEGWVCLDCGKKFTTKDAQNAVRDKLQQEEALAKKQQEKEAQLATWHTMIETCPYPADQLEALYADAVRQEEEAAKRFRDACDEERKTVAAWQGAMYGLVVGGFVALAGILWVLLGLLAGGGWGLGILVILIGCVLLAVFNQQDERLFEQYASEALRALKQERIQAVLHKAELKKYREAWQGIQAEEGASASAPTAGKPE